MKLFPFGTNSIWTTTDPPRSVKAIKCIAVLLVLAAGIYMAVWLGLK